MIRVRSLVGAFVAALLAATFGVVACSGVKEREIGIDAPSGSRNSSALSPTTSSTAAARSIAMVR